MERQNVFRNEKDKEETRSHETKDIAAAAAAAAAAAKGRHDPMDIDTQDPPEAAAHRQLQKEPGRAKGSPAQTGAPEAATPWQQQRDREAGEAPLP